VLDKDDVLIESVQKEGLATLEERGVTAALDTVLTPELVEEGFAREVISKLQTMRKDAGFEVTDRVHVTYQATPAVSRALAAWDSMVRDVVLALSLTQGEAPQGAYTQSWDINGEETQLSVMRA